MKGEVSSLPCPDNLQPLLQRCRSFKASSWQHENRHKHEAQPQALTAIPPGEKGMTTGGSWSPEGQGLMGSRTQRSSGQRETQGQTSNNTGPHWQRKPFAFSADPSQFLQKWGLAASSSYIFNSSYTAKTPGRSLQRRETRAMKSPSPTGQGEDTNPAPRQLLCKSQGRAACGARVGQLPLASSPLSASGSDGRLP